MELSKTVLSNFKVKIAVDTQILAYLVDKTYPTLNTFIECLTECPFVDVVCSRFVTYEFIGIRKLEHYLRAIHTTSAATSGIINFGSLLKYKNDWSASELDYADSYAAIKLEVERELQIINDDIGIFYAEIELTSDLWKLHQDLVLSSKVSKEDSLVLLSCILSGEEPNKDHLIFLTNDERFYKAMCGKDKIDAIDNVFASNGMTFPHIHFLRNIVTINPVVQFNAIANGISPTATKQFITQFISEHIQAKNKDFLLGRVLRCPPSQHGRLLCFELLADTLNNDLYVSIVSKNLDFIYNHPVRLVDFHAGGNKINAYPYIPDAGVKNSRLISVVVTDTEGNRLPEALYNSIVEKHNFLFLHPDSN